jgi:hypothetical protein
MYYRDSLRTKPRWLRIALGVRKHIGLISLWMLLMHIIGSVMFFNQAYLKKFFVDPTAYSSKMNWIGEVSFACGVWGFGMYSVMGVCSLPSVASAMTSKQWWFVFGPVAWLGLALGFVHTIVQGCTTWYVSFLMVAISWRSSHSGFSYYSVDSLLSTGITKTSGTVATRR